MKQSMYAEITALILMRTAELKQRYAEVFGEETRSNNRAYLIKRILWRIQANAGGGLSERARRRADELADDAELRRRAPSTRGEAAAGAPTMVAPIALPREAARPMPGSIIVKEHRGRRIVLRVLERGFEFEGKVYRSLSAIANEVTGGHCSGVAFFDLKNGKKSGKSVEATR